MRGEWEMQQFAPKEFAELFDPLKPVYDPRMMLFAEVDGEPAGIAFGFGDPPAGPIALFDTISRLLHKRSLMLGR